MNRAVSGLSLYHLLYLLPKNHISYLMGKIAYLPMPACIAGWIIRWFARHYGASLEEAKEAIETYHSLGEFFVRDLKPGLRPIGQGVVSPVDAILTQIGQVQAGLALQIKGREYSLAKLFGSDELPKLFEGGTYLNFYLAPGDYHHIHAPVSGKIKDTYYLPGKLWPVNSWSLERIGDLFAVNERIISFIQSEQSGCVAVVMVGATNVGSIRLSYDSIQGNAKPSFSHAKKPVVHRRSEPPAVVEKGSRIGTFSLGSTVLLFFEPGRFFPGEACQAGKVKMGCSLGTAAGS